MSQEYFNRQASDWDGRTADANRPRLQALIERFGPWGGAEVLDVGTGTGILLPLLLDAVGPTGGVCGLDFAQLMLVRARQKSGIEGAHYVLGDATCLPVNPRRFDVVICYSSFPHFSDKRAALSEMHRVLKTGGRLVICHSSSRNDINKMHGRMSQVKNDLLPSEKQLRRMLAVAGFTEIAIEDMPASYAATARKSDF